MEYITDVANNLPEELVPLAKEMRLPDDIIRYLLDENVIGEHMRTISNQNVEEIRLLTTWEKYYISSGIVFPKTIVEHVAVVSYGGMVRTSVELLANIQLKPIHLEKFRQITAYRSIGAQIGAGFPAGSNVADAIVQPLTQMTLNSFKTAGSGKNVAGGLAVARSIIDMAKVSDVSAVIFFREQYTVDDIIISGRVEFNEHNMEDLLLHHQIDNFDDLQPVDWYENFFGSENFLYRQQFENPRTLRLVLDYETIVQYKLDPVAIIRQNSRFKIDDIFSSPPMRWDEIMGQDDQKVSPEHYVIVVDILAPQEISAMQEPIKSSTVLNTPGNILASEQIPTKTTDTSWYGDDFPLPAIDKILRLYVVHGEGYADDIREQLSKDTDIFKFIVKEILTSDDADMVFGKKGGARIEALFPLPFILVDIFHGMGEKVGGVKKKKDTILTRITVSYAQPEVQEASNELLDDIFLYNKLLPKIRSLKVGGRDGISGLFPLYKMLGDFVVSSRPYVPGVWEVIFNKRMMREYTLTPNLLLYKLRNNNFEIEYYPWEHIHGISIYINSEQNPRDRINSLDRDEGVVYAETNGGKLEQILSDPLINPYGSYINDVNAILRILGIEAARNFLIRSLVDILAPDGSLDIDSRHLLLFVDLVTRSGQLSKTLRLGEYEPSSELEIASLRAPMDVFANAIFQRQHVKMDVGANLMMGFMPKFGSVANPAMLTSGANIVAQQEQFEDEIPQIEGFDDLPDLPSLDNYQEPSRQLSQSVAQDLADKIDVECPSLPILEETIKEPEAIIVPAINFSSIKIPKRLRR